MTPSEIEPATFRFVAQHLNHCDTAVPNKNEYQEYFLGGKKRPVRKAENLTTILGHCHVIWEPYLPGTLSATQACNGTDLPFFFYL